MNHRGLPAFARCRRSVGVGLGVGFVGATLATGCQSLDPEVPTPPTLPPLAAVAPVVERPIGFVRTNATPLSRTNDGVILTSAAEPAEELPKPRPTSAVEPAPTPVPAPPSIPSAEAAAPVDLVAALRLAGVANPTINLAQEVVREALARQLAARALLIPTLTVGTNLHVHRGALQASPGFIRTVNSQSLYYGIGARTLAAESVAFPGLRTFSHLGDAAFEPLAARQRVTVRTSESQAVQNEILREVAAAYLELVGAEARADALRVSETQLAEIARVTAVFAREGQGRAGDANRAVTHAELFRSRIREADREVAAAGARLAGLLSLDPSVRLRTPGGEILPVRLVDEASDLESLVEEALRTRPEVFARLAAVGEARTRVKQEKYRPFLPTVSVGVSTGFFGGGSNTVPPDFGAFNGRTDFDVLACWTFANGGAGNVALTRRARAVLGQSVADLVRTQNRVREEVSEAKARAQAARQQIEIARRALATSTEEFRLDSERVKQGQGRPIEVLDSFDKLADSRQEAIRTVVEYDVAQFRLFVALGLSPLSRAVPEPRPNSDAAATDLPGADASARGKP